MAHPAFQVRRALRIESIQFTTSQDTIYLLYSVRDVFVVFCDALCGELQFHQLSMVIVQTLCT